MSLRHRDSILVSLALILALPALAQAQFTSLGVYCWQLLPFNDRICFNIQSIGDKYVYPMDGTDEAAGSYRYPIAGALNFYEYKNVWRFTWQIYFFDSSAGDVFGASISPTTLSGTWKDPFGLTGTFQYLGTGSTAAEMGGGTPETESAERPVHTLEEALGRR